MIKDFSKNKIKIEVTNTNRNTQPIKLSSWLGFKRAHYIDISNNLIPETLKEFVCFQLPKPSTFSQLLSPLPHNYLILADRIKSRKYFWFARYIFDCMNLPETISPIPSMCYVISRFYMKHKRVCSWVFRVWNENW